MSISLKEYQDLILECLSLKTEYEGYEKSYAESCSKIEKTKQEYDARVSSITSDRDAYIRNEISRKILVDTADITYEIATLEEEKESLKTGTSEQELLDKSEEMFSDYIDSLVDCKNVLDKKMAESDSIISVLRVQGNKDVYHSNSLEYVFQELESGVKELQNLSKAESSKEQALTTGSKRLTQMVKAIGREQRLLFAGAVIVAVTASVVLNPLLALVPSVVYSLVSYKDMKKKDTASIAPLAKLKYYVTLCDNAETLLSEHMKTYSQSIMDKEESSFKEKMDDCTKKITALEVEKQSMERAIHQEIMNSSDNESFEREQRKKISAEYEHELEKLKEINLELKSEFETQKAQYDELVIKQEAECEELKNMYFNLTTVGESKILPEMFLLGMDGYEPVTLEMLNYVAHIISTTKKNKTIFATFVRMCVTQILCSMNPSCIKIYIADIENGTTRFGIFGNLEKNKIVELVTTEARLTELISELYAEKIERDKTVTRLEDSITTYNEQMIKNCGLTLPYKILILTHYTESVLTNQEYFQLLTSGYMGIVVLSMWDRRLFELSTTDDEELGKGKVHLVHSILESRVLDENGDVLGTTNISSLSNDGKIIPLKRQEIAEKEKSLINQLANIKNIRK